MDVQRSPEFKKKKKRRRVMLGLVVALAFSGISYVVWSLEPALREVDAASVYADVVRKGSFMRAVRGPGTLVPVEIRWITAETDGQVDKILIEPGTMVTPDSVILLLTNPVLEQQVADAELSWRAAESDYTNLKVQLADELMTRQGDVKQLAADWKSANLEAKADRELNGEGLVPDLKLQKSELAAEQATVRYENAKSRLAMTAESHGARLAVQRHRVDQQEALYELRRRQLVDLEVRSSIHGILQDVPVDEGQRLTPGTFLARVAKPDVLKAELRIAQTQAKDVQIGQTATIDTRNGLMPGHVSRIDPAVQQGSVLVDVKLDVGELPKSARIDLSVDGNIELERVEEALIVNRPVYGQANSAVGLFKVDEENVACRRTVRMGRLSVNEVEILEGLEVGDRVILSDSSQWDDVDCIRLR